MKPHFKFREGVWTVDDPNGHSVLVDKNIFSLYYRWNIINNLHLANFTKIEE